MSWRRSGARRTAAASRRCADTPPRPRRSTRLAGPMPCAPGHSAPWWSPTSGADYKGLSDRTRVEYRRHLDAMTSRWRDLPLQLGKVDAITRKHILEYRDEFADTPSVGNARVKVLRLLLSFAVDRDQMTANPALRIKRMAEGEYEPWPEAIIKQFRDSEPAPDPIGFRDSPAHRPAHGRPGSHAVVPVRRRRVPGAPGQDGGSGCGCPAIPM